MKIYDVTDPEFIPYGRVIKGYDLTELLEAMKDTESPLDHTIYVASDARLEALPIFKELQDGVYGECPIELGYCNGFNRALNALEYHRSSEINIAAGSDAVLLVGKKEDVTADFHYDTSKVMAFRIPEGMMVEVYATTLHYAPCVSGDEKNFRVVVILPKGTNGELVKKPNVKDGEERLLFANNKWLIAHKDGGQDPSAFIGLDGENITI